MIFLAFSKSMLLSTTKNVPISVIWTRREHFLLYLMADSLYAKSISPMDYKNDYD